MGKNECIFTIGSLIMFYMARPKLVFIYVCLILSILLIAFICNGYYCDYENEFKNVIVNTNYNGGTGRIKIVNKNTVFFSIDKSLYIMNVNANDHNFVLSVNDIILNIIHKQPSVNLALVTKTFIYIVNLKSLSVAFVIESKNAPDYHQRFNSAIFLNESDILVGEGGLIDEISQRSIKTNKIIWNFDFSKSRFNLFNKWEMDLCPNSMAASKNEVFIGFPNGVISFDIKNKTENKFANLGNNYFTGMSLNKDSSLLAVSGANKIYVLDKNLDLVASGYQDFNGQRFSQPVFLNNDNTIGLINNGGCNKGSGISFFSD